MRVRFDRLLGQPVELAHLGWRERTALMEESQRRNWQSPWGRQRRWLWGLMITAQLSMVLWLIFGTESWLPSGFDLVLFSTVFFVTLVVLSMLDLRHLYRELEMLMLERGIRPAICFKCRYDLQKSTSDACPECGEAIATQRDP